LYEKRLGDEVKIADIKGIGNEVHLFKNTGLGNEVENIERIMDEVNCNRHDV